MSTKTKYSSKSTIEEHIKAINREFAIIKTGGILCRAGDEEKLISTSKFREWLANREVSANEWLKSPLRREYERIVFKPGVITPREYNLWKGFSVEPFRKGTCDLFLNHIRNVVCRGKEKHFNWVMSFFAEIVQRPTQKSGVSLVLRGPSGSGKTLVGEVIGSLFLSHYMLVDDMDKVVGKFNSHMASLLLDDMDKVVGKFNSHMASLLLLQADEASFGGDPRNAGKLRSLVTRTEHVIEPKGVDAYRVPNYMRLMITSEEDWVIPASLGERRFAIFDVSGEHVGDYEYFEEMFRELNNGGRERLLYELQRWPLVDLRKLPQTRALRENKLRSLNPEMAWWVRCLEEGTITGYGWETRISKEAVYRSYVEGVKLKNVDRSTQTMVGMFLRKVVPTLYSKRNDFILPELDECIEYFEERYKLTLSRGA